MKKIFLFLFIITFFSCSSTSTKSGKTSTKRTPAIKPKPKMIMSRKDPPDACIPMSILKGTYIGLKPNTRESLKEIRIKAEKIEANYVRIDGATEGGTTVHGMAFKCP